MRNRMTRLGLPAWVVGVGLALSGGVWGQAPGMEGMSDDTLWKVLKPCESLEGNKVFQMMAASTSRYIKRVKRCEKLLRKPVSDPIVDPSVEIERLLKVCEAHLAANRLTTGVGGTAVACYREVQSRDRNNIEAVKGLQRVFEKYAAWARAALEKGEVARARGHLGKLKQLNPEAPEVEALQAGIERLEKRAADSKQRDRQQQESLERERLEQEKAERERLEQEKAEHERLEQRKGRTRAVGAGKGRTQAVGAAKRPNASGWRRKRPNASGWRAKRRSVPGGTR